MEFLEKLVRRIFSYFFKRILCIFIILLYFDVYVALWKFFISVGSLHFFLNILRWLISYDGWLLRWLIRYIDLKNYLLRWLIC